MARPRSESPTPAELEILQIIWERGPCTVGEAMELLDHDPPRAYTSVMSLMSVMSDKGLLERTPRGRAFVYAAKAPRDRTLKRMVGDLLERAFNGSASALVTNLLDGANPSDEELDEIRDIIATRAKPKRN
ncbi:MAG: BlaI/MecI/CopY family transcriptional regulator [Planctomycetes bacterium]|nr:BlaI/MecI/CopY family transcriptional regulator [Planctomycetota bacterium]